MNERTPAPQRHHEEREHADGHVVAVHHVRTRIVRGKRWRHEGADHRQDRERQRAARYREYTGAHGCQHQQPQALRRGQVTEQGISAVGREIGDAERCTAECQRDGTPMRQSRREERGVAECSHRRDAEAELECGRRVEVDGGITQQSAHANDHQCPADFRGPVAADDPGEQAAGSPFERRVTAFQRDDRYKYRGNNRQKDQSHHSISPRLVSAVNGACLASPPGEILKGSDTPTSGIKRRDHVHNSGETVATDAALRRLATPFRLAAPV